MQNLFHRYFRTYLGHLPKLLHPVQTRPLATITKTKRSSSSIELRRPRFLETFQTLEWNVRLINQTMSKYLRPSSVLWGPSLFFLIMSVVRVVCRTRSTNVVDRNRGSRHSTTFYRVHLRRIRHPNTESLPWVRILRGCKISLDVRLEEVGNGVSLCKKNNQTCR